MAWPANRASGLCMAPDPQAAYAFPTLISSDVSLLQRLQAGGSKGMRAACWPWWQLVFSAPIDSWTTVGAIMPLLSEEETAWRLRAAGCPSGEDWAGVAHSSLCSRQGPHANS